MAFQRVRMSLLLEIWCTDVPFSHGKLVAYASRVNARPMEIVKSPKGMTKQQKDTMKIDVQGFPYWDCQKGQGKRHYILSL